MCFSKVQVFCMELVWKPMVPRLIFCVTMQYCVGGELTTTGENDVQHTARNLVKSG